MADYITVVIQLPEDQDERKKIAGALRLGEAFHGGRVTAMSLEDEMTVLEMIEAHEDFDSAIAEEAREKARELHRAAEAAA